MLASSFAFTDTGRDAVTLLQIQKTSISKSVAGSQTEVLKAPSKIAHDFKPDNSTDLSKPTLGIAGSATISGKWVIKRLLFALA